MKKEVVETLEGEGSATAAGVVARLAAAAAAGELVETTRNRTLIVLPDGVSYTDITDPQDLEQPGRVIQAVTVQTKDSLGEYVRRFGQANTVLMADIDASRIVGVIDYHGPEDEADFTDHRASLQLKHSVEWDAWAKINGKLMDQLEFARFLEENAADVVAPAGADLLEIARDMNAVRGANFKRVVRTSGEDEKFEYTQGVEASAKGGTVEVPSKFKLEIPVYYGEQPVALFAFLRWKLTDGGLALGIQLHRPEHVRQAVFQQIVLDLAASTEKPAYFGKLG